MNNKLNIAIIEPFFGGSHKYWIDGLIDNLEFKFYCFTLPARHWKWRMESAAVSLAHQINLQDQHFDAFIVSDMLNVALFKALLSTKHKATKLLLYFHENQLTYPWSKTDEDVKLKRDKHYQFINYTSALVADKICFNSFYNKNSFLNALPKFLKQFPDEQNLHTIPEIIGKSNVLPLAFDTKIFSNFPIPNNKVPVILWNHRWEFDKNPDLFFQTLIKLKSEGIKFELIVTGENYKQAPKIFSKVQEKLKDEILHFGYVENKETYQAFLKVADVLPVTSNQDFFGISIVEAIFANTYPLLPNRLAYPEHIPESLKEDFLYEDDALFKSKLKNLLIKKRDDSKLSKLKDYIIEKYSWDNLKEIYETMFLGI